MSTHPIRARQGFSDLGIDVDVVTDGDAYFIHIATVHASYRIFFDTAGRITHIRKTRDIHGKSSVATTAIDSDQSGDLGS